jgi:hypothetical protein
MSGKKRNDKLVAIWVFTKLSWSFRRIARLTLPSSHHTVRRCYKEACELFEAKNLPIFAKDEKALRIRYVGSSKDIEYIHGKIEGNQCGGGRRIKPHHYDDEYKDSSEM